MVQTKQIYDLSNNRLRANKQYSVQKAVCELKYMPNVRGIGGDDREIIIFDGVVYEANRFIEIESNKT